jgi:hypothetical protein
VSISPRAQIFAYLDAKREDRYHRTALDEVRLGDATTDQIQHYLACRRQLEEHLDEESVFDELCRLAMQADEETTDWFDRIAQNGNHSFQKAEKLAAGVSPIGDTPQDRLTRIALGMLEEDGWAEHEVAYALGTLGTE